MKAINETQPVHKKKRNSKDKDNTDWTQTLLRVKWSCNCSLSAYQHLKKNQMLSKWCYHDRHNVACLRKGYTVIKINCFNQMTCRIMQKMCWGNEWGTWTQKKKRQGEMGNILDVVVVAAKVLTQWNKIEMHYLHNKLDVIIANNKKPFQKIHKPL